LKNRKMEELIILEELEKDLKSSIEKDFNKQRETILRIAKNLDKIIKLKQKEAQKELIEKAKLTTPYGKEGAITITELEGLL